MADICALDRMGAIPLAEGVAFRVWAPHAQRASVIGSFNGWDGDVHPMQAEDGGYWSTRIATARIGDHYKFLLATEQGELQRIDPYAREVTSSVGNGVIHDPNFDWEGDDFVLASWNQLVIYELHVGTFSDRKDVDPGQFAAVTSRLDHLSKLGINAIQIMPVGQFAGERSWGYNPSHSFAVDSDYGGAAAFKHFIKRAHQQGIAVILDVVYNHLGPSDLDLWQFDGWSENDRGGIYFYNDDRAHTPWGETRPDYGRGEVRQYFLDNVCMWLEDYHLDGLRFDSTSFIRSVQGADDDDLPDGWSLLQAINDLVARRYPGRITIAEDMLCNDWLTRDVGAGGAGFGAQWDIKFVQQIREAVITQNDEQRSLESIRSALTYRYNNDAFERVIYSESHDDVANGQSRVPQEVNPGDARGWYAQKRSTLAAAMIFTAPGLPMLFHGQEFLEGDYFRDSVPLDWDQRDEFHGIVRLYRDLIGLRLNRQGVSRGLCGQCTRVFHENDDQKIIAFHRWDSGGPADDVLVIANFSCQPRHNYTIGFPADGRWQLRFNSDWQGYSEAFEGFMSSDAVAEPGDYDGFPFQGAVSIGPYSALIYTH
jgi:1,4-alpha-glucan branching enzyme